MYRQQEVSRVLARWGARLITQDEIEQVAGGIQTNACSIVAQPTCHLDGDCPPGIGDIACPRPL